MAALFKFGALTAVHELPPVNVRQERVEGFTTERLIATMQQCRLPGRKGQKHRPSPIRCYSAEEQDKSSGDFSGASSSAPAPSQKAGKASSGGSAASKAARPRGFGGTQGSGPSSKAGGAQRGSNNRQKEDRIEQIVQEIDKDKGRQLDISPSEAAQGKVDFVRVDNWGPGESGEEVGNLRLKSFSPAYSTGEASGPFYEGLVKRLQLLESKGELAVAQARPLPPFERWAFGEERYLQYLTNQLAVHSALEDALACQLANPGAPPGTDAAEPSSADVAALERSSEALAIFGEQLGLHRSRALQSDIDALTAVLNKTSRNDDEDPNPRAPTTQAAAYAKYLHQLGREASTGDQPGECQVARHQLLAHVFAIHVAHLTSGMRVGSKAVSTLPVLRRARAVSFYRDYPPVAKDPLKVLVLAVNRAGELLAREALREQVMEELPRAIQKTSLLLSDLAVEERVATSAA